MFCLLKVRPRYTLCCHKCHPSPAVHANAALCFAKLSEQRPLPVKDVLIELLLERHPLPPLMTHLQMLLPSCELTILVLIHIPDLLTSCFCTHCYLWSTA